MIDIRKIKNGYWWDSQKKFESLVRGENTLKEITIQITDKCNMNCVKCNKTNFTFEDMKTEDVLRIINEACELGLKHIHFTGGEPTLHNDFPKVLAYCRDKNLRIDMSSNGKFSEELMKEMNGDIDSINISWDFEDQIPECMDFIFKYEADVFVNHMVMPSNYRRLPDFLTLIKRNYEDVIDIQLMPPRGNAQKFTTAEKEEFTKKYAWDCFKISQDRFEMVSEKVLKMFLYIGIEEGIYHDKIDWFCHRSKSELRVGTKGFVTCTYLYRDGHITCELNRSVKDAWKMCKKECEAVPPMKDMCQTSCSPEVAYFNMNVEKAVSGVYCPYIPLQTSEVIKSD